MSDDTVAIKGPVQESMGRIFDKEIDDMSESSKFGEWVFIDFMILDGFESEGIFFRDFLCNNFARRVTFSIEGGMVVLQDTAGDILNEGGVLRDGIKEVQGSVTMFIINILRVWIEFKEGLCLSCGVWGVGASDFIDSGMEVSIFTEESGERGFEQFI